MYKKSETKQFITRWYHDQCGGELKYSPPTVVIWPEEVATVHLHRCDLCKQEVFSRTGQYPKITLEDV